MAKTYVSATINGEEAEFLCETQQTLLDVLRDVIGLTGSKEGCASGDCGACSVIMDGRLVCSCLVLGVEAEGTAITTIEGIAQGDKLHPVQQKFLEHAALQCGFCTPGLIVASKALAGRKSEPDRNRSALLARRQFVQVHRLRQDHPRRHGCRRRTPRGDSWMNYIEFQPEGCWHPSDPSGWRRQGHRARGVCRRHPGFGDAVGQDQALAACPCAHHFHRHQQGRALPGVKAVGTAKDFPVIASEEAFMGEGPMNFRDLSLNIMARDKALYEGHAVAAVAATTQAIADDALELIDVQYEVLPFVIDVEAAMAPDAPVLHDDLFTVGVSPAPDKPSNIAKVVTFKKGDIEAGFREAEVVVEGRYTTQPVHQAYIEPHACLATYSPDGQITIHASSQGHFMIRAYTAKLLGLDMSNIRVNR